MPAESPVPRLGSRPTAADRAPQSPPEARRRWREFLARWGAVVAVSAAALSILAVLGEDVFDHAPGTLDAGVRAWALAHRAPAFTAAFAFISRAGAPAGSFLVAVLVAVWLWRAHARHVAPVVLGAPVVAVASFNVVKQLVHRTRPAGGLLLRTVTFSFPSGHATAAAAVFPTVAWVLAREGKVSRTPATLLAIVPPLLIGLSRIYLDVHWTTDVLAGWCAGAAVAAFSAGVYERGRRRRAHPA